MPRRIRAEVNISKLAVMTVVINGMQMLASVALVSATIFAYSSLHQTVIQVGMALMSALVCWGAVIDIREAFLTRRISEQADMLEDSYRNLEDLNYQMRKQRHDFMNHLQVVYSLVEMGDTQATCDYIERVYGDLKHVGSVLKTSVPAVNALIAAKQNDAEDNHVVMETEVRTTLEGVPVAGWALCRVLGNLIDNALDALKGRAEGRIRLLLSEDVQRYRFRVWNNGPAIPEEVRAHMFEERYSTKGTDRGMGLSIVRDIIGEARGTINVTSDETGTEFEIILPKSEKSQGEGERL